MTFRSALPILLGFLLLSEPATVHAADNTDITANPPFESMASPDTVPIGSPNRAKNLGADRSIRPDRQALRRGLTLPVTEDGVSEGDSDSDGVGDVDDNCPNIPNADQRDADGDGVGDACETEPGTPQPWDRDGDGVGDVDDNCPAVSNPEQADRDRDGTGDACEIEPGVPHPGDADGDGVGDVDDNCPDTPNTEQADHDGDGIGDACAPRPGAPRPGDGDGDGIADHDDNCPEIPNADQRDSDRDGIGDACPLEPSPPPPVIGAETRARIEVLYRNLGAPKPSRDRERRPPPIWTTTLHQPGAEFIKVHFASLNLPEGDSVTVSRPDGRQVHAYPNESSFTTDSDPGFWALSIVGDTAVVTLHSRRGGTEEAARAGQGLTIDKYRHGKAPAVRKAIWGGDDLEDVACYEADFPTEFRRSDAVGRFLLNNGASLCTGWRIQCADTGHVLTNEHCISSQADVSAAELWFNFQAVDCDDFNDIPVIVAGDAFIEDSNSKDFALLTVTDPELIADFGALQVDARKPDKGEEIYIPQHPAGRPKQFGIDSDLDDDDLCRVRKRTSKRAKYKCDTLGGSSGSPVLARSSHRVLALHHQAGWSFNRGVRMDKIWPLIEEHFESCCPTSPADEPAFDGLGYVLQGSVLQNSANTCRLHLGDFNADGRTDLLRSCDNSSYNALIHSTDTGFVGAGYVLTGSVLQNSANTCRVHVGDFDNDDHDDVLRSCNDPSYNALFRGTSTG
ncbi:MAG: thrombospondin type 3 repeat-containing protein, partial [Acidobacteriota bacterium]